MRLYSELLAVVEALERADVPFAICGGLAVAIHGYVRATKDIDLLVPATAVEDAKQAVKPLGFFLPAQPMTFGAGTPRARRVHRMSKIEGEDHMVLDLLEVSPADQAVWDSRLVLEWEGKRLCVVSRAGLARMKRVAGRDRTFSTSKTSGSTRMSDTATPPVDMSPEAIARRLRDVSDILELCLSLQKAKVLGPARKLEPRTPAPKDR